MTELIPKLWNTRVVQQRRCLCLAFGFLFLACVIWPCLWLQTLLVNSWVCVEFLHKILYLWLFARRALFLVQFTLSGRTHVLFMEILKLHICMEWQIWIVENGGLCLFWQGLRFGGGWNQRRFWILRALVFIIGNNVLWLYMSHWLGLSLCHCWFDPRARWPIFMPLPICHTNSCARTESPESRQPEFWRMNSFSAFSNSRQNRILARMSKGARARPRMNSGCENAAASVLCVPEFPETAVTAEPSHLWIATECREWIHSRHSVSNVDSDARQNRNESKRIDGGRE